MANWTIEKFGAGVHNLEDGQDTPKDSAKDAMNWITRDGRIELARGKVLVGVEGAAGNCQAIHFGTKVNGGTVQWRKCGTKIQYFNGSSWADTVTGLSATDEYTFSNYQSLAGTFTYATGPGGLFKFHNANPGSYIDLYDSTKNFKGYSIIDKGRMLMWGLVKDQTGLYGSKIDPQSTNYTTVTNESIENGDGATATFSGTLAFKPVDTRRNAFGVLIKCVGTTLGTFTVTIASPGVFTKTGHGLTVGNTVRFSTTGALPTGLSTNTNYYVISSGLTADNFQVSATLNGSAINTSGSQSGTHTLYNTSAGTGQESFTDNYDGTLTGSAGGTGTINYITGEYSVTFVTIPPAGTDNITADYLWENSNSGGVTDFTKSATRLAAEGFTLRQDEGGDAILAVVVGMDGSYYSMKSRSAYRYTPDSSDLAPTNEVVRKDIGISNRKAVVSTGAGILFVNTANPDRPELTVLEKNPLGDNILSTPLLEHFAWVDYEYDDAALETWGEFLLVSCKTVDALVNDTLLLADVRSKTVDITSYGAKCLAKDSGSLYIGSPYTQTVYKAFDGFDDDGDVLVNTWDSKDETYRLDRLKKYRRLRLRGLIGSDQSFAVYANYDGNGYQLIGTVLGSGDYVDRDSGISVGSHGVGISPVGGGSIAEAYPFFVELKVKVPKFQSRSLRYVALGLGYLALSKQQDFDILTFEQRIPKKNRQAQNVSLDGTTTGNANPSF